MTADQIGQHRFSFTSFQQTFPTPCCQLQANVLSTFNLPGMSMGALYSITEHNTWVTSSMSGSFQAPGSAYLDRPMVLSRHLNMPSQEFSISCVVLHELPTYTQHGYCCQSRVKSRCSCSIVLVLAGYCALKQADQIVLAL